MSHQPQQPHLVFWILWASMLVGIVFITQFLGGGFPSGTSAKPPSYVMFLITISGACISTLIRWFILPKINNLESLLTTMIIGLALAESTTLLGIFLIGNEFPSEQRIALGISFIALVQYMPLYLSKLNASK